MLYISDYIFLSDKDKSTTTVGFAKGDFKYHKGIDGLKYYLIVMYLRKHLETFGEISFTLKRLLDECGYSTNTHNSSIYMPFRKIIENKIINYGFAASEDDIMTISPTSLYTLNLSTSKNIFFTKENFVQFSIKECETIIHSNTGKINKSVLVGVYLYIKQFILSESSTTEHVVKISYPSKQQIRKGIGVSSLTTVETAILTLERIGMIYVGRDMYVEDFEEDGTFVPTRNVFALEEAELNSDTVLLELKNIYKRTVYRRYDVPGKFKYLKKE